MSDVNAIIIAAIITVGGILATFITNLCINGYQRKEDSKERFFYEMFQRRLALYEEIIKALDTMGKPEGSLLEMTADKFGEQVIIHYHTILTFINRLRLFGSNETQKILEAARAELQVLIQNDLKAARGGITGNFFVDIITKTKAFITYDRQIVVDFSVLITNTSAALSVCVQKETAANFMDSRINEVLIKFASEKKRKDLHSKDNAPINDQNDEGLALDEKDNTNNADYC